MTLLLDEACIHYWPRTNRALVLCAEPGAIGQLFALLALTAHEATERVKRADIARVGVHGGHDVLGWLLWEPHAANLARVP